MKYTLIIIFCFLKSFSTEVEYKKKLFKEEEKITEDTLKERIKKLNSLTPIEIQLNEEVENQIFLYLNKKQKLIKKIKEKGEYYFPLFEEILDKHNLPLELKYVPIIESALKPRAKSPAGATGLWQFMYNTGKAYNLKVNSYVDERMDPYKATEAACFFLKDLYEIYKDWYLVLAAYNAGSGNLNKAIKRAGGSRNFWKIRNYLPKETQNYIPAFIAINYVMNFNNIEYEKEAYIKYNKTDTIIIKGKISFKTIEEALNISEETIEFLNPEYKIKIIPFIEEKKYTIKLPIKEAEMFIIKEDSIYAYAKKTEKKSPEYVELKEKTTHYVKKGEYLGIIAEKHGCSVKQIIYWNGLKNTIIKEGEKLLIFYK